MTIKLSSAAPQWCHCLGIMSGPSYTQRKLLIKQGRMPPAVYNTTVGYGYNVKVTMLVSSLRTPSIGELCREVAKRQTSMLLQRPNTYGWVKNNRKTTHRGENSMRHFTLCSLTELLHHRSCHILSILSHFLPNSCQLCCGKLWSFFRVIRMLRNIVSTTYCGNWPMNCLYSVPCTMALEVKDFCRNYTSILLSTFL